MIITRDKFPIYMTRAGLTALRAKEWDGYNIPEMRQKFFEMRTTEDPFVSFYGMVGMGNARLKPEATPTFLDAPQQGRPMALVFPTYGLGSVVSKEVQDDDKSGDIMRMVMRGLKRSIVEAQEASAEAFWTRAYTLQGTETDGVPFFSSSHLPLRTQGVGYGTSWSNRSATDIAFSITGLNAARQDLSLQMDDSGRWITLMQEKLRCFIHPNLEPTARQIVKTARVTGSNWNDTNIFYDNIELIVSPRIFYTSSWRLKCDDDKCEAYWYDREAAKINMFVNYSDGVTILTTRARWSCGAYSGRGYWSSRGA